MALKWGICAAGKISNDFCSALKTLPKGEHEIVAVAARDASRAKEFGEKFGATRFYGSYEEIAKDSGVDIIYIGTIHTMHYPLSIMMLNAGKHVLCEKPMAMNLKQCREVLQLCKDKNLFFKEAVWSRSFPIYEQIRKEIASGSLGDVNLVTAKFCIQIMNKERIKNNTLGGGCLLDIGIYPIQLAAMVFNELPEKIIASSTVNKDGVDEDGAVILRYKGGRMASLVYSGKTHDLEHNRCSIHGTKGSIEIPANFWCPEEAFMPSGRYTNDLPIGPVPYNFVNCGGLRYQADNARKCIQAEKIECEAMSHRDSEILYTIIDEIKSQIGLKYKDDE